MFLQATRPPTAPYDDVTAYWREGHLGHEEEDQEPLPSEDEDEDTESTSSFTCGVSSESEEGDSDSEFPSWVTVSSPSSPVPSTSSSSLPCQDCGMSSLEEVEDLVDSTVGGGEYSDVSSGTPPHDELCHPEDPCLACEQSHQNEATAYMEAVLKPSFY